MRLIKFRAWDTRNKQMIIPVGLFWNDYTHTLFQYCKEEKETRIAINIKNPNNDFVLMQFTGLKDKNGLTEIYEGDIVRYEINNHPSCQVIWQEQNCRYLLIDKDNYQYRCDDHTVLCCEVIGNIYESKHLLDNTDLGKNKVTDLAR